MYKRCIRGVHEAASVCHEVSRGVTMVSRSVTRMSQRCHRVSRDVTRVSQSVTGMSQICRLVSQDVTKKSFGVANIHAASHLDQRVDMLTQTGQAGG